MKPKPKIKPVWAGWALTQTVHSKRHHQTPLRLRSFPEKIHFPFTNSALAVLYQDSPAANKGLMAMIPLQWCSTGKCSVMEVWDAARRGQYVGARIGHGLGTADPWVMHSSSALGLKLLPLGDNKETRKYIVLLRILCVETFQTIILSWLVCND